MCGTRGTRGARGVVAVALLAVACPGPKPDPVEPTPGNGSAVVVPPAPIDAPEATEEERLAAIQKAMNELDEAAQGCWAVVAASQRFDVEGELVATIEIEPTTAKATIVRDTANNARLATCLTTLLGKYRWAPPLHGQTIQLPFKFRAPDGQNVIDRDLVDRARQGKVGVAVLLDELNTGNGAASMFEVALAEPGAATGMRRAERAELWYLRAWKPDEYHELELTVSWPGGKLRASGGDMLYVPRGAVRDIKVDKGALQAVVAVVPGGREGAARGGALPTPEVRGPVKPLPPVPVVIARDAPKQTGPARIFVEPATVKGAELAASLLRLPAGANVAEHVHAKETELLFVLDGSGTMTVAGVALAVTRTSVVQIPANTKHAFTAATDVAALQIYTPAGPEQRFKKQ